MRSMLVFLLSLLCTFVAARGLTGQRIGAAGIGVAGVGDIVAGVGDIGVANVGDIGVGVHIGTNPMWGVYGARRCGTHAPWRLPGLKTCAGCWCAFQLFLSYNRATEVVGAIVNIETLSPHTLWGIQLRHESQCPVEYTISLILMVGVEWWHVLSLSMSDHMCLHFERFG